MTRLYHALCKYWRPISKDEFWNEMDMVDVREVSSFIPRDIWDDYVMIKPKPGAFEMYRAK